jgi:hypothetical protein
MTKYYSFLLSFFSSFFFLTFFTLNTIFAQTTSITRSDQVATEEDLQAFAENIEILNEKIEDVTATTNPDGSVEISVSYVQPKRFLGYRKHQCLP